MHVVLIKGYSNDGKNLTTINSLRPKAPEDRDTTQFVEEMIQGSDVYIIVIPKIDSLKTQTQTPYFKPKGKDFAPKKLFTPKK